MLSPEDESFTIYRRRPSRFRVSAVFLALLVCAGLLALYAAFIEPKRLELTHHILVGKVRKPLRIAHLSDLHTSGFGPLERTLAIMLQRQNPDLIVITGDVVDHGKLSAARDLLANLSAPLGVWVVRGNWERWTPVDEDERTFYPKHGARFLENAGAAARDDVWIAGLDDPSSGTPDLSRALTGAPLESYKVVLMHAPDYFAEIGGRFDLALAGHTHGGQVVLPLFGPLWLPPGGRRYVRGFYSQNGSQMYVSRGIGTSIAPIRFGCRPELVIIDIRPR